MAIAVCACSLIASGSSSSFSSTSNKNFKDSIASFSLSKRIFVFALQIFVSLIKLAFG
ncbi:SipW-dependent-type signal peptide-containing protein [Tenacibaculum sp. AHE15PA]|uniref:SipW-dependent-type signal peptide-containing protein n=1 Tax=unclassified Tenacibaculum TaxID=2635139 RepID=UPI00351CEAAB